VNSPSIVGIGAVPLYKLEASYYFINGIDNQALTKEILAFDGDRAKRYSNNKAETGEGFEDVLFNYGPESQKLSECFQSIGELLDCQLHDRVWAQVHHKYESCNVHNHEGAAWGLVYYVSVPKGSGSLYFQLPYVGEAHVHPVEGMCVLFPGRLPHGVTKNLSDDLRISVAGNLIKKQ
jgi:hypothetical protein